MAWALGRGCSCAAVIAAAFAVGCGSVVALPEEDGTGTGSTAPVGAGAGGATTGPGTGTGVGSQAGCGSALPEVAIQDPTSASFVEGVLHMAATVDGHPTYAVIEVRDGVGYVVETHDELTGPANLVPVPLGGWYARLRRDSEGSGIDLVSAAEGREPHVVKRIDIEGEVPPAWQSVFAVVQAELITCVQRVPGEDPILGAVDADGAVRTVADGWAQPCSGAEPDNAGMAFGDEWVQWRTGLDGGLGGYLEISDLTTTPPTKLIDYNYNPDGVHAYGSVRAVASDGTHVVFDIGNESRFFVHDRAGANKSLVHAWFTLPGPKQLLGVIDGIAYVVNATEVALFDIGDAPADAPWDDWHAPLRPERAEASFGDDLPTLLAGSDQHLLGRDSAGRLYLVPALPSGTIEPMRFFAGEPPTCD